MSLLKSYKTKAEADAEMNRMGKLVELLREEFKIRTESMVQTERLLGGEATQRELEQCQRVARTISYLIQERNTLPTYDARWPDLPKDDEDDNLD